MCLLLVYCFYCNNLLYLAQCYLNNWPPSEFQKHKIAISDTLYRTTVLLNHGSDKHMSYTMLKLQEFNRPLKN
jgi:hypothetical protein